MTGARSTQQHLHSPRLRFPRRALAIAVSLASLTPALPARSADQAWNCRAEKGGWVCEASSAVANNTASSASQTNTDKLGWVPLEELSPEQRALVPDHCCGAYIPSEDLVVKGVDPGLAPDQADTRLEYDLLEGDLQAEYEISGDVIITQGARRVTAERAVINETANTATVIGDIQLYEPGVLVTGERAVVNRETGAALIDGGQFVLYESRTRGAADQISRSENEVLTLEGGMFTQCEPGREHWALRGSSIEVDPNRNRGVARNARLELAGVPVFWWPYLIFPVGDERQSGFLFPTITSDDIAVPYYLNLAPNFDLTLTPRYVAERGAMLEAEFRHLSPVFETLVGGAFLPSGEDGIEDNEEDAIQAGLLTIEEATEFDGEDRWLAVLQQKGGRGRPWYSLIDYTKVSDFAYFNHLDTTNLEVNRATHLRQAGELGYLLPNWNINTRLVEYQTIALDIEEPYQQLPEINALGSYQWDDLSLSLDNHITNFDHDEEFLDPEAPNPTRRRITGSRARLDYELAWDKEWLWGFIRPAALLKGVSYKLDEEAVRPDAETDPSIIVPQAALDMGLFFEREGSWFGDDYLQTFEPRVFYFYSDFESHEDLFDVTADGRHVDFDTAELTFSFNQLFRTRRFAGGDRIADANQVSVGLTTRFLGETGAERLSVSLGQIFYQDDLRVTLDGTPRVESRSELAGQFSANLTDSLRFGSDLLYDPETNKMNRGNVALRYLDRDDRIFNLGYRYDRKPPRNIEGREVEQNLSQGDVSVVWPVTDSVAFVGRQYYDFTNDRELDSIAGLEYASCCYNFRLIWRRWLDNDLINRVNDPGLELEYDQGIFLQLQLRGLGGIGSSNVTSALGEGIYNFNRREEAILGRPVD
ncbi:LPS-assembly protein LptD [Proteobacteria bacterium 005FR1]|nr:LPS-assembly protein LptD [Proteobacteria bacterium 005FR1]